MNCNFINYTSPIADIIKSHGQNYHLYADDTQLYISFSISSEVELAVAKCKIEACVRDIDLWMVNNKLKLNGDKTEVAVLSASHLSTPKTGPVNISGHDISPSKSVRNIGVIFDASVSLDCHIAAMCKACFFHIHNIWKIRKHLSLKSCETLVHAFISSKLDFCNSLLYGLSESCLANLQHVQNAAVRLVTLSHKREHVSPLLFELHWLPIKQRIKYKILLLCFKSLNGCAPSYLSNLLHAYVPTRSLRSSAANLLVQPSYNFKKYGRRAFKCAGPELWNSLPQELRQIESFNDFKLKLKTYLFKEAYCCV